MRRLTPLILLGVILFCAGGQAALNWQKTFKTGLAQAKKDNKLVLVDMYAEWCGPCKLLDKDTFSNKDVAARLSKNFIVVKIDIDRSDEVIDFAKRFNFNGDIPHIYFINSDGKKVSDLLGYIAPADFLKELDRLTKEATKK
jgi:thiol:disulfide interchange protein